MTGTEIAPATKAALEAAEAQAAELAADINADIDANEIALPLIKLAAPLTKEVKAGNAQPGQLINSITGYVYGDSVELVIAGRQRGRFYSPEDSDRAFVALGDVAPDNWPDEYAGQAFADIPDAEEQYKAAANDDTNPLEWGSGPPIATTHNFIGFVRGQTNVPVRLSLMKSSAPAARTVNTLIRILNQPWDAYVVFQATEAAGRKGSYHKFTARQGEATSAEDRLAAIELAQQLRDAQVTLVGDEPDDGGKPAKPKAAAGAMDID
jgi:multidrug efflux pump subunit AcrA (membrane-fusion protein)